MTSLFAISKAVTRQRPVKLSMSRADLQRAIEILRAPKEERKQRRLQIALTQVSTEHTEEQAAMEAPEIQRGGGAALLEGDDSIHAESSQSGVKASSRGASIVHHEG
jgi:hypothetical protein